MGLKLHVLDVVHAACHQARHERQHGAALRVRTTVLHHVVAVRGDATVLRAAHLRALALGAPVTHGEHVLGAGLGPPCGTTEPSCRPPDEDLVGIHAVLGAEAAAHVGCDDAHVGRVDTEHTGQTVACTVGTLAAGPLCETVTIPARCDGAHLERCGCHLVVLDGEFHHHVTVGEDVAFVVVGEGEHHIGAGLGVQDHVAAQRLVHVDDSRQRVIVHDHHFCGVHALGLLLADHHGHQVTHVAHGVDGKERELHGLVQHAHVGRCRREVDILGGPHVQHAGHRLGLAGVDGQDAGVRHGAAHVRDVDGAGQVEVRDVGALAGEEPGVLHADNPGAENAHALQPPSTLNSDPVEYALSSLARYRARRATWMGSAS